MALAVISINTQTQECVLTVDGALIPANKVEFYYTTNDPYNGLPYKRFKYTISTTLPDGATQDLEYEMVTPEESGPVGGMISREIKTKDKLYKEVEAFVNKN